MKILRIALIKAEDEDMEFDIGGLNTRCAGINKESG